MLVSVVIPTRNRASRLLALLRNLNESSYPLHEVIVVDSSDVAMELAEYSSYERLNIIYIQSEPAVCVQRNLGIQAATAAWVFICDDDIEVPADYVAQLMAHVAQHPEAGAVSGVVLQMADGAWVGSYPLSSKKELVLKYVFQMGIWGEINCKNDNLFTRRIRKYYARKGNHISKAGWPVITDFSGEYFTVPTYGLGASVIRRDWLLASPYDEVLDRHGIGDNYGLAMGFPEGGIHVVNAAVVYHHHEPVNRIQKPLQYYRRALALDYFVKTRPRLRHVSKAWMLWSLLGNAIVFAIGRDALMIKPALKTFWRILGGKNPYYEAYRRQERTIEPAL